MYLLFVILMVIAALLMCFIVLIQNSKGGGLASGFSSSNSNYGCAQDYGLSGKSNMGLWHLHGSLQYCFCLSIPSSAGKGGDVILEQAQQEEKTNPYNMPVGTEAPQSEAPAPLQKLRLKLLLLQQNNSLRCQVRLWGKTINGKVQTDAAFL